ncbi:MAG: hypothetical protein SGILL_003263, partial [Bacillariaceae sp.]
REPQIIDLPVDDENDSGSEEDDESVGAAAKTNAFAMMNDESDDEEDSENDDESSSSKEKEALKNEAHAPHPSVSKFASAIEPVEEEIEDLDSLLAEYKLRDEDKNEATKTPNAQPEIHVCYNIITRGMDPRDLDIDYVMRTSLLGPETKDSSGRGAGSNRKIPVFGPPRDNWPRALHYVGGGMGMISYEDESKDSATAIPWPYSEMKEGDERCPPATNWFKFIQSDSYRRDLEDLEVIKASGDANALAMFVAHHPFVVEALLQLSIVLYQTSHRQEGLSIVKRIFWVFECAAPKTFLKTDGRLGFLDYDLTVENSTFFDALFLLMRVYIAYKDTDHPDGFECELLDLPNWAYSYALALFRIHMDNPSDKVAKEKADHACKCSLARFPHVASQLLAQNDVDATSRSMQMDWSFVLSFVGDLMSQFETAKSEAQECDAVVRACSHQAYETIVHIFVQQNHALWGATDVMKWIYSNLVTLKERHNKEMAIVPLNPAIMRFARCDPTNYEDKFQTMPVEANPLDANVIAHALVVQLNRPRFLQRGRAGGTDDVHMGALHGVDGALAGPPTVQIDADSPLLEIFWRSALPWAHVEGVPPPNRDD